MGEGRQRRGGAGWLRAPGRRATPWIAAVVAGLLLSPAAAAGARRAATFSVKVEGTQTSSATLRGEICSTGASSDAVVFAGGPFRIRVEDTGALLAMTGLSKRRETGRQLFTIAGTVTRSNSGEIACKDRTDQPSDCGTKPFTGLQMALQGFAQSRRTLDLNVILWAQSPPQAFTNCYSPVGFPAISADSGTTVHLSASALLNRRRRKIVVSTSQTSAGEGGYGASTKTTLALKLTLARI